MKINYSKGHRVGSLTYVKEGKKKTIPCGQKLRTVVCKCDCGTIKSFLFVHFSRGRCLSCGKCDFRKRVLGENVIGKKYGTLTVINELPPLKVNNRTFRMVQVKCDCGVIKEGRLSKIKITKSCGCLSVESLIASRITHGLSNSRIYGIWQGMQNRCYNKNVPAYRYYGAKGVFVCDEWKNSFEVFYEWSMNNGYTDKLTLDRYPDYRGGYTPSNCRWATNKEQQNNKSTNKMVTYKGETMTLSQLCEKYDKSYHRVNSRLNVLGWGINKSMETERIDPVSNFKNTKQYVQRHGE